MSDHLYICNTRDMHVLINYYIYTISNSFTIFNNNYCNSHEYHNKTLHSCDRIALIIDTERNTVASVNY